MTAGTRDAFDELLEQLAELDDLRAASALLDWDQHVMMPPGGASARALQLGTLRALAHRKAIEPGLGQLLEDLREREAALPAESFVASVIRVARRDYEKAVRVPVELTAELTRAASEGVEVWTAAREADDYAAFRPTLDRMLDLNRRYVACFEPEGDPYDVLLDIYEPGISTTDVAAVFDRLQPELRRLVQAAGGFDPEPFEAGPYDAAAQQEVSLEVARAFGAEPGSFRLDETVHPFCEAIGIDDVRLTTRYPPSLEDHALFSTMHETGHGLYEHGIDPAFARTPLASGLSMALHESQSRLWENVIGRSPQFWAWFYPRMQEAHPELLAGVSRERFLRSVNRVRPSFIRVSADEVTYGLHIILRFELERALLDGSLATADLPEAWRARFEELLGIRPPDDRLGCLQDVHWAGGLLGYFPTYQLGNVISVQIWERLASEIPDADEQISRGDFSQVHEWLRTRLYALGRTFTTAETLERVVGGPMDPAPYVRYLEEKLRALDAA